MTSPSNPADDPIGTVRRAVVNGKVFVKSDDHGLPVWNRVFGADNRSYHEKCASEALPASAVIGAVPGTPAARRDEQGGADGELAELRDHMSLPADADAATIVRHAKIAFDLSEAAVQPEAGRSTAELNLYRERDALTRKALQTDEDGPLQFLALRVRQERDRASAEVSRLTAEVERLQVELGTIRGELADFAQESVPSHVSTLQAVRWLIAEHDEQVKHNEEVGEENRALCDERDELAATVNRLRAGNAEYAKVFATWQSLWDEKEEWEKAAKEAWQRENVGAWLVAESRWMLRGMARRATEQRRYGNSMSQLSKDTLDRIADALGIRKGLPVARYVVWAKAAGDAVRDAWAERDEARADLATARAAAAPADDTPLRERIAEAFVALDTQDWGGDHGFVTYGNDTESDAFVDAAHDLVAGEMERLIGVVIERGSVIRQLTWLHAEAVWQQGTLRADKDIRQGALNDVLGHPRSADYYAAVEDVAQLRKGANSLLEQVAAMGRELERLQASRFAWAREADRQEQRAEFVDALMTGTIGVMDREQAEANLALDTLGAIWLYVDWRYVSKQLTTQQKELWADAIDAFGDPADVTPAKAERWWRNDFVDTTPADIPFRLNRMPERAREIVRNLRANGFDAEQGQQRQVLGLAEEVGEFVGAYRRWSGQARRSGTAEEMYAELADVVITAFVTAEEFGVDLETLIGAKLRKVFSRGWREQKPAMPEGGAS